MAGGLRFFIGSTRLFCRDICIFMCSMSSGDRIYACLYAPRVSVAGFMHCYLLCGIYIYIYMYYTFMFLVLTQTISN